MPSTGVLKLVQAANDSIYLTVGATSLLGGNLPFFFFRSAVLIEGFHFRPFLYVIDSLLAFSNPTYSRVSYSLILTFALLFRMRGRYGELSLAFRSLYLYSLAYISNIQGRNKSLSTVLLLLYVTTLLSLQNIHTEIFLDHLPSHKADHLQKYGKEKVLGKKNRKWSRKEDEEEYSGPPVTNPAAKKCIFTLSSDQYISSGVFLYDQGELCLNMTYKKLIAKDRWKHLRETLKKWSSAKPKDLNEVLGDLTAHSIPYIIVNSTGVTYCPDLPSHPNKKSLRSILDYEVLVQTSDALLNANFHTSSIKQKFLWKDEQGIACSHISPIFDFSVHYTGTADLFPEPSEVKTKWVTKVPQAGQQSTAIPSSSSSSPVSVNPLTSVPSPNVSTTPIPDFPPPPVVLPGTTNTMTFSKSSTVDDTTVKTTALSAEHKPFYSITRLDGSLNRAVWEGNWKVADFSKVPKEVQERNSKTSRRGKTREYEDFINSGSYPSDDVMAALPGYELPRFKSKVRKVFASLEWTYETKLEPLRFNSRLNQGEATRVFLQLFALNYGTKHFWDKSGLCDLISRVYGLKTKIDGIKSYFGPGDYYFQRDGPIQIPKGQPLTLVRENGSVRKLNSMPDLKLYNNYELILPQSLKEFLEIEKSQTGNSLSKFCRSISVLDVDTFETSDGTVSRHVDSQGLSNHSSRFYEGLQFRFNVTRNAFSKWVMPVEAIQANAEMSCFSSDGELPYARLISKEKNALNVFIGGGTTSPKTAYMLQRMYSGKILSLWDDKADAGESFECQPFPHYEAYGEQGFSFGCFKFNRGSEKLHYYWKSHTVPFEVSCFEVKTGAKVIMRFPFSFRFHHPEVDNTHNSDSYRAPFVSAFEQHIHWPVGKNQGDGRLYMCLKGKHPNLTPITPATHSTLGLPLTTHYQLVANLSNMNPAERYNFYLEYTRKAGSESGLHEEILQETSVKILKTIELLDSLQLNSQNRLNGTLDCRKVVQRKVITDLQVRNNGYHHEKVMAMMSLRPEEVEHDLGVTRKHFEIFDSEDLLDFIFERLTGRKNRSKLVQKYDLTEGLQKVMAKKKFSRGEPQANLVKSERRCANCNGYPPIKYKWLNGFCEWCSYGCLSPEKGSSAYWFANNSCFPYLTKALGFEWPIVPRYPTNPNYKDKPVRDELVIPSSIRKFTEEGHTTVGGPTDTTLNKAIIRDGRVGRKEIGLDTRNVKDMPVSKPIYLVGIAFSALAGVFNVTPTLQVNTVLRRLFAKPESDGSLPEFEKLFRFMKTHNFIGQEGSYLNKGAIPFCPLDYSWIKQNMVRKCGLVKPSKTKGAPMPKMSEHEATVLLRNTLLMLNSEVWHVDMCQWMMLTSRYLEGLPHEPFWLTKFVPRRRSAYVRCLYKYSLEVSASGPFIPKVNFSFFIKREKETLLEDFTHSTAKINPRVICNADPISQVLAGPILKSATHMAHLAYDVDDTFTYFGGLGPSQQHYWLNEVLDGNYNCKVGSGAQGSMVAIENDFSKMDCCYSKAAFTFIRRVYEHWGLPVNEPMLSSIMEQWEKPYGAFNSGIKISAPIMNASGRSDTALMNVLINVAVQLSAYIQVFTNKDDLDAITPEEVQHFRANFRMAALGDDSITFFPDTAELGKRVADIVALYGFETRDMKIHKNFKHLTFLGMHAYPAVVDNKEVLAWGPTIGRFLFKHAYCEGEPTQPRRWLKDVAEASNLMFGWLPIIGELCRKEIQLLNRYENQAGVHYKVDVLKAVDEIFKYKAAFRYRRDISTDSRMSSFLLDVYGLSPRDLQGIVDQIDSVCVLPSLINTPTIVDMVRKDTG